MSAEVGSTHITIIGAGATGCALLPLLAVLPGVSLSLVDGDTVEEVNLLRQPLYGPGDVGRPKVEVAMDKVRAWRPLVPIHTHSRFLDASNARRLIAGSAVVADCTDDLHARQLIDTVCGEQGIPLVTGAVHGQQIQVATFHVSSSGSEAPATLRGLFPDRLGVDQDGCDMRQVPAHVTTLAAAVMARHVHALMQNDHSLAGMLELIDTSAGRWLRIAAPTAPQDGELIAWRPQAAART